MFLLMDLAFDDFFEPSQDLIQILAAVNGIPRLLQNLDHPKQMRPKFVKDLLHHLR